MSTISAVVALLPQPAQIPKETPAVQKDDSGNHGIPNIRREADIGSRAINVLV